MTVHQWDCNEAFRRLDDYLDRELTPEEMVRLEEHFQTCRDCALEARFEAGVIRELKEKLRRTTVPPGLLNSILDTLR